MMEAPERSPTYRFPAASMTVLTCLIVAMATGVAWAGAGGSSDCPGDLDDSGVVDGSDLAVVLGGWGPCPGCLSDIDGTGTVDGSDLAIVLGAWGECPGDDGTPTCDELAWLPTFGGEPGMNYRVHCQIVFDDGLGGGPALYAGGSFTSAAGVTANRIAKWNPRAGTWSPLGSGLNDPVIALAIFDDGFGGGPALYAGGYFTTAGGVTANRIAKWNPVSGTWSPLGSGLNDIVLSIAVFDDGSDGGPALYAGGEFTTAGGVAAKGIAKWNPTSGTWSPLGTGMVHFTGGVAWVRDLAVFDDGSGDGPALYAGGHFTTAGGVAASYIARWNGSTWSPLGSGLGARVHALAVLDNGAGGGSVLYVGGLFTTAGGVSANFIAQWNPSTGTWSPLASGLDNRVEALEVFDDGSGGGPALYAGGVFSTAGGVMARRVARWHPASATWSPLGSGMTHWLTTGTGTLVDGFTVFDDGSGGGPALYACGEFSAAGGVGANRIARWNGSNWSPVGGSGMNAYARAFAVFDDGSGNGPALYVGGDFTSIGSVTVNRIAKWSPASKTWSPLGSGMSGTVRALTVFDDGSGSGPALYAAGDFAMAGGVTVNRIARWNPASGTWSPLGSGLGSSAYSLAVIDDGLPGGPVLFAGGSFGTAGGVSANRIARWDPASGMWSPLGNGFDDDVLALTIFDDGLGGGPALYAGGEFLGWGGGLNRMARWNAAFGTWSPVGSGLSGTVRALTVVDDGSGGGPSLYSGGDFTISGGVALNRIARWNAVSGTWSPLGGGAINSPVHALAVYDDGSLSGRALYAGGNFTTAGGVTVNRIAKWDGSAWMPLGAGVSGNPSGGSAAVHALAIFDDGSGGGSALYVGGQFAVSPGGDSYIAKWGCPGEPPAPPSNK